MNELLGPSIRAVLVDRDETFLDYLRQKAPQHVVTAREDYGVEILVDQVAAYWGAPLETFIGKLYNLEEPTEADISRAVERYYARNPDYPVKLIDGAADALRRVKDSGRKLGVVTAARRANLDESMADHPEVAGLFDYTQAAEESDEHKPHPGVFAPAKAWLAAEGIPPEEAVYIGDTLADRKAACDAGLGFIAVCSGLTTPQQFIDAGVPPENVLASIAELQI